MRFLALACDYDGTLALNGAVDEPTIAALKSVLASGRKLILVTGRELDELLRIFPAIELFEWVVAENGAVLYQPRSRKVQLLADAPPEEFVRQLKERGVERLSVGRAIVASWVPFETIILGTIRDLGLDLQVIFNKDAVMVLPSGVNKATGLAAVLAEMQLSPHNVVAVGDAENDHAMLAACECSVAVQNALAVVKERVDVVTERDHGAGVAQLIDVLTRSDLKEWDAHLSRHDLLLGQQKDGAEVCVRASGANLLIAGPSGSGKSTAATAFIERLMENQNQFCIIDPEGDYDQLEGAVTLGSSKQPPLLEEALTLLTDPSQSLIVNLIGLPVVDRPQFFMTLLPRLQELRSRTGRPHWLIIDEAHHLLPGSWQPGAAALPSELDRFALITVHPQQVAAAILKKVDLMIVVGSEPAQTLDEFSRAIEITPVDYSQVSLESGEVLCWSVKSNAAPFPMRIKHASVEHHRHLRKYAEGELTPERSFYFRGPDGRFNLRANNLITFVELAGGVDDALWLFHLRKGDYSRWFRDVIKDVELANVAEEAERSEEIDAAASRAQIKKAIEDRYTLPASGPLPMPGTDSEH